MKGRSLPEYRDYGPLRFPLPEGHPLLDDEDALEAALLQEALGSVEGGLAEFAPKPPRWRTLGSSAIDRAGSLLHGMVSRIAPEPALLGSASGQTLDDPQVRQEHARSCGIQCQKLILERFGIEISEHALIAETESAGVPWEQGLPMCEIGRLLEAHGVPVRHVREATLLDMAHELALGHQVIVGVESGDLWRSLSMGRDIADFLGFTPADHAVIVTGIDTTDPRRLRIVVMDPGTGEVARRYAVGQFLDAWADSRFSMVCTRDPVPRHQPGMENFPYERGRLEHLGCAPFELVESLHETIDRSVSRRSARAVLGQFLAIVHGHPLSPDDVEFADFLARHSRLRKWFGPQHHRKASP